MWTSPLNYSVCNDKRVVRHLGEVAPETDEEIPVSWRRWPTLRRC